jgi:hypothetical protein
MFPENLQDREKYIEDHVISGDFDAKWTELIHESGGRRLKLNVMDDALKIDGVRVNVSAKLSQRLADLFDASLPTPLVADLMYRHAVRRAVPRPMPISTSVTSMLKHSADVGKQIDVGAGLASTVGKHWVLDKQLETKPGKACNYGWHFTGSSYQGINGFPAASKEAGLNVRVIQPNATAHDPFHSDYSQICQLVSQLCWLDDVEVRFSDLLKDPTLHFLVSHQGPLSIDRQPGVPKTNPILVLFPIDIIV